MLKDNRKTRTRFAPSPTGELHIGGLRTALSNYLFTRKNRGKFILRIEDTDQKRFVEGAEARIIQSLNWAGITIDEGRMLNSKNKLIEKGSFGPYIQSKRLQIYRKYIQQLLNEKKAYYCFCSSKRLDILRKEQEKNKRAPKYDRHCLNLNQKEKLTII